jgi:hypothetical protein
MRNLQWLWIALIPPGVALIMLFTLSVRLIVSQWQAPRVNITRESFDQIQVGMTEAEVVQIIGGPSGRYTKRPYAVFKSAVMSRCWWEGDEGVITVTLTCDSPRRVRRIDFDSLPPESILERFDRVLLR